MEEIRSALASRLFSLIGECTEAEKPSEVQAVAEKALELASLGEKLASIRDAAEMLQKEVSSQAWSNFVKVCGNIATEFETPQV